MEKFRELKVWQKAHQLSLEVYQTTAKFPDIEKYGLVSQMRRAAVSVVANIVEGTKRRTSIDRVRYHCMAEGSLEELKYYFILSVDLRFLKNTDGDKLTVLAREVGAMLNGLSRSLRDQ